ncbi:MAG: type II 3-dehydroquinate dehydratase [Deferribacterota bacterium]|nr:type II 3-dehydroquinate dehydratase [Deferribacterota bacterium]
MRLLIINGPNINLLGSREINIYGELNYNSLKNTLKDYAAKRNIELDIYQSNYEGEIVEKIQKANTFDGIIINAGAYTHTSIAIRDALLAINKPFVEIHISNVFKRESFRQRSFLSDIAVGIICGFGLKSYILAIKYFELEEI